MFLMCFLFLTLPKFRITRNYKMCSLPRKNLCTGLSQVRGEATASGIKTDIEHMGMDRWHHHPVATHLVLQLPSSSHHVHIQAATTATSRKWESSPLLLWISSLYQKKTPCRFPRLVAPSLSRLLKFEVSFFIKQRNILSLSTRFWSSSSLFILCSSWEVSARAERNR